MKYISHLSLTCLLLFLTACTAHYPVNTELTQINPGQGYRPASSNAGDRSPEITVALTFSGGGTRAAAFSYGVLEALRDTTIRINGVDRRMLDEIDSISSVSGGSFTAAYYALFGDQIFNEFEHSFLKRNVQRHLTWGVFNPLNILKLGSRNYGRSELAAEYYDKILFQGKTFGDMLARGGPFIRINASDISLGAQFIFTQNIFDLMCSDITNFPVSRAVAASSAVPVLFSSVTIENFAGTCDYELPYWAKKSLEEGNRTTRSYYLANKYSQYMNREERSYIHLYDGGLTDNLGVRPFINSYALAGDAWRTAKFFGDTETHKILFIIVNAKAALKTDINKLSSGVPLLNAILGSSAISLKEYSFESMTTLRRMLEKVDRDIAEGRCADWKEQGKTMEGCDDIQHYMVEIDLELLLDVEQRKALMQLPTSFSLEDEEVDELRQAARTILQESSEFQRFLNDMK